MVAEEALNVGGVGDGHFDVGGGQQLERSEVWIEKCGEVVRVGKLVTAGDAGPSMMSRRLVGPYGDDGMSVVASVSSLRSWAA